MDSVQDFGHVYNRLHLLYQFLGAFLKLRRATIGFVMSVRLSVRNPTGRILMKFDI